MGCGLREEIKLACAGKVTSAAHIIRNVAIGADWCNAARGFMLAVGCIQAQACHTNECPVGVATQNPRLARAVVASDKGERVHNLHRNTVHALAEVTAAAGLDNPWQLHPGLVYERTAQTEIRSYAELYDLFEPGQLLEDRASERLQPYWDAARADSFRLGVG